MLRRILTALAAVTLTAGAAAAVTWTASATTLTCTNLNGAVSPAAGPFGCGGLQSAYTAKGLLDLNATGNFWNAKVTVAADSQSANTEDWTAFAVNHHTTGGPGNLGLYVAMSTRDGLVPSFTVTTPGTSTASCSTVNTTGVTYSNAVPCPGAVFTAGPNVYCLSVQNLDNGPHGALRWHTVLRNCNTNGAFTYGTGGTTQAGTGSVTGGHANAYQVWAPVNGPAGLLLLNETLSHFFHAGNTPFVLDIAGFGGAGTQLLAFPENDGLNQQWSLFACTPPGNVLGSVYHSCP